MLVLATATLMTAVALPRVHISPSLLLRTTSLVLVSTAALATNALDTSALGSGLSLYSGLLEVSTVSQSVDVLIMLAGAVAILPWAPMVARGQGSSQGTSSVPTVGEYAVFVLFTTTGATLLVSSADLITLYLAVELQSFAVYVLAALYRDSEAATDAGLKYLLLGGLSSSLILLGSALVYAHSGLTSLEGIYSLLSVHTSVDTVTSGLGPCAVGLTVLAVGLLFKASAAPFHQWAPDVYDRVPTIVTTWLAVLPKISVLALLLELQGGLGAGGGSLSMLVGGVDYDAWTSLLLVSSLLSLLVGTVVGLAQSRLKRLLTYSTVSHVGFLLLALAVNTEEGFEAYTFYLAQYTATSLLAFSVLLAFGYVLRGSDISLIGDLSGQLRAHPLLSLSMATALFSMAGVPPLVGFFAKQSVLYSAVHSGYLFMALVAIVVSVVSAAYYLRVVRVVHFDALPATSGTATITAVHSFVVALLTMSVALFVLQPSLVLDSASLIALSLHQS